MECIFCKIIDRKIPADIVYENDEVLAFKDINPETTTHILFVPKKHIERLDSLAPEETEILAKIYSALIEFSNEKGLGDPGFKTKIHVGSGGGQVVFHLHIHLLSQKKLDE